MFPRYQTKQYYVEIQIFHNSNIKYQIYLIQILNLLICPLFFSGDVALQLGVFNNKTG